MITPPRVDRSSILRRASRTQKAFRCRTHVAFGFHNIYIIKCVLIRFFRLSSGSKKKKMASRYILYTRTTRSRFEGNVVCTDMCTGPSHVARAKLMAAAPTRARGTYLRARTHETTAAAAVAEYRSDTERIKTPRGPPLLLMAFACIPHTYNI